jgi:hypothetical protein
MTGDKSLSLLAYPLTEVLHGTAHVHRLPSSVDDAWSRLRARYRMKVRANVNLPYSGLATALRAYSGACVNLFPSSKNQAPQRLVSSAPLDRRDVHDAVVLWEQAVLGVPDEEIVFDYPSELADLIADSPVEQVSLAEQVHHVGDQPDAPNWVYDAATWECARRLASVPWRVDGREVPLRADTDGNLVVWADPALWSSAWKEGGELCYAALRIRLLMKSLPGVRTPVVVVDPSVSRLSRWLGGTRSAWLAPRHIADPLLCLAVEGRGRAARIEVTSGIALSVSHRLRGENLLEPGDLDLAGTPGRLRALVPKSVRFPIGRGVGMYTVRELGRHAAEAFGVPNVTAREVRGHRFSAQAKRVVTAGRDADLLDESGLPAVIKASGGERLRVLALYRTQRTRARLQRLLAHHFARPDLSEGVPEDTVVQAGAHVEVVFHHAASLLAHGSGHRERAAALNQVSHLVAPDGTRVLALCETEFDGRPLDEDAKPVVSRMLAERGVLAQFLATAEAAEDPAKDHAGNNAVADLLRAAGLVHPRLTTALASGSLGTTDPITYVGLHVRAQRGEVWTKGAPKLSWSLVAMIPDGEHWRTLAYQFSPHPKTGGGTGWQDYFTANTAFRAHPLPGGKRQDEGLVAAIDTALGQLRPHVATGAGYVVMVSGDSSRSLWPLLANKNLDVEPDAAGRVGDRPALPGWDPALGHRARAVVRVTSGTRDLPRPVEVRKPAAEAGKDPHTVKTTRSLYRLDGSVSANTWILANIPRQFAGSGRHSRAGLDSGRWSTDAETGKHTWYAHTSTEIVVVGSDSDPQRYAVAAARLCDHAVSWDGRTSYPAPVHLAALMDRNHPEYRRTVNWDDGTQDGEATDATA